MTSQFRVGPITVGRGQPLLLIGGPCVLEQPKTNMLIASTLRDLCRQAGFSFVFKASFDKANRSSAASARGPGMEAGLAELASIRKTLGVPVTTDVHEPQQADAAAKVADLLQVPAFLCRQTDLLSACAATGKPVNVKKGQFLAPQEMRHVINKLKKGGCDQIMLTERGTFFGYHRLVNDFLGLGDLMALGCPVCFDVTHSTQLPGAGAGAGPGAGPGPGAGAEATGGRPDRAALLARAAVAAGVDAIFLECHPQPEQALSDASTMQPLAAMADLLAELAAIRGALRR